MQLKREARWADLPSDFFEPISVALTVPDQFVKYKLKRVSMFELEQALKLDRAPSGLFGRPTLFAIVDGKIWLCPIPDQDYQLEVIYFSKPKSL